MISTRYALSRIGVALFSALCFVATTRPAQAQRGCPGETHPDLPPGYVLIEGDIIVSKNWCQEAGYSTNLWPGGIVPYEFDVNVTLANQQQALRAMMEWMNVANVTFVVRTTEPDYLHIQDSTANNSYVGPQGGLQIVNIVSWQSHFVIVHELGHALGYWHEQSRADRDCYVQINFGNIQTGQTHNFQTERGGYYGPYDFDSVMHYRRCAFSKCGDGCASTCETITVLPPNQQWQNLIGQRDHLSFWDGRIMSFLYPEPHWRFLDETASGSQGNGTLLDPYTDFTSGYNAAPAGGTLWILTPQGEPPPSCSRPNAVHAVTGAFTRPMTLEAPFEDVILR